MAVMLYALYTYHWRANSIRRGGRGPYDDRFGPVSDAFLKVGSIDNESLWKTVLCIALLSESIEVHYPAFADVCSQLPSSLILYSDLQINNRWERRWSIQGQLLLRIDGNTAMCRPHCMYVQQKERMCYDCNRVSFVSVF